MKNIIFILFSILTSHILISQSSLLPKEITISAANTADGVRLVWTPSQASLFELGKTNGYTLTRYTISVDGVDVPLANLQAEILNDDVLPLPQGDPAWTGELGEAAEHILHSVNQDINTGAPNLSDAFAFDQEQADRYQFGMFVAYMDFNLAQKMGLAYHDQTSSPNSTYMYKISINQSDQSDKIIIATDSLTSFATVDNIAAVSEQGHINVSWPIEGLEEDYFAYNILRSDNNVDFDKINDEPYVFFYSGEDDPLDYVYKDDTLLTYGNEYYYAIEGLTIFGVMGEASSSVSVTALPYLTNIDPVVELDDENGAVVALDWIIKNDDVSVTSYIDGYLVYRSSTADSGFELLTPNPISAQTYTDNSPIASAYYIVATVDNFGTEYRSLPEFAQIEDAEPPAIPVDLSVRESSTNQYELSWTENTEVDLEGYLLYTQYAGSENYVMISNDILESNTYIYNYPPDLVTDEICFKISAIDQRGNESEMSECISVVLPDNIPPSRPYLSKHQAVEQGVALGWAYSTSPDVAYHDVERKRTGAPGWEVILQITADQEQEYETNFTLGGSIDSCYIDSTFTELRSYDYRITAVDSADNKSYSTIVSLTPFSVGTIGQIENFTVSDIETVEPGIMPQQSSYDLIQDAITTLAAGDIPDYTALQPLVLYRILTAEEYEALTSFSLSAEQAKSFLEARRDEYWIATMFVTLEWDYDNLDQLLYFQIYRSVDGRGYIDYIDILPEEGIHSYQFDDGFIMAGHQYLYKIVAAHAGGRFSAVSEPLLVRVPE